MKRPADIWGKRLELIHATDHLSPDRKSQGENFFGKLGQSEMSVYMWELRKPYACPWQYSCSGKS